MHRKLALVLAGLAASGTALAVPTEVTHQGRLFDALGAPLDGATQLDFAIYDSVSGGSPIWSETHNPTVDAGYYSVVLGRTSALDDSVLDGDDVWMGISIDSGPELPRQSIGSVPYAVTAGGVSGGTVNASEVQVNGTTIIDSSGNIPYTAITGTPAASDTLLDLGCTSAGDIARYNGSAWECVDDDDHQHDPVDINGTLAITQLPVGNTSSHVAAGDHSHSSLTLTGGLTGTSADFSQGVRVGDAASGGCGSAQSGTLQWNGGELQVCSGSVWLTVTVTGPGSGVTSGTAGDDCADILSSYPSSVDGTYWIDPTGSDAYQTYCDMTTFGGGWTLIFNLDTDDSATRYYTDSGFWTTTSTTGFATSPWIADYKSQAFSDYAGTELMIKAHNDGSDYGAAAYDMIGGASGQTMQWMMANLSNTTITNSRKDVVGSVGNGGGLARVAGDAFVDFTDPVIVNSNYSPADSSNLTRLGTNYSAQCSTIDCNGHNFGGMGGRHARGGWGTDYEAAALNGYCSSYGSYGTNGQGYAGNNAFAGGDCTNSTRPVDYAVWIR